MHPKQSGMQTDLMTPHLVCNGDLPDNPGLKPQWEWLIGYLRTHTDYVLVEPLWNKMNIPVTGSAQMMFVTGSAQIMTVLHAEYVHFFYSSLIVQQTTGQKSSP